MNYSNLSKSELLEECEKVGIQKCKSKNKQQLIDLLKECKKKTDKKFIIEDDECENVVILNKQTSLKPLVKWSGGKSDEIKQFEKYIPLVFDTYLEPFIGGGSLYFHLSPQKSVISDVHSELIDFYK